MATYLGANCVYIVFIATTFQKLINTTMGVHWDVRLYIAVVVFPCLILGEIRQLKYLVPFSAIANLCIVITFGITLYYMLCEPLQISERPLFSSWKQLPLFFRCVSMMSTCFSLSFYIIVNIVYIFYFDYVFSYR